LAGFLDEFPDVLAKMLVRGDLLKNSRLFAPLDVELGLLEPVSVILATGQVRQGF